VKEVSVIFPSAVGRDQKQSLKRDVLGYTEHLPPLLSLFMDDFTYLYFYFM